MEMGPRPQRRLAGPGAVVTIVLGAVAIGLIAGIAMALSAGRTWEAPMLAALAVGAIAGSMALGLWWWSRVDEAAREAHKWAWWWGGCPAMGAGAIVTSLLVHTGGLDGLLFRVSPTDSFALGVLGLMTLQSAGYSLAWAGWWLARR